MGRFAPPALAVLLLAVAVRGDDLKEAESILSGLGSSPAGSLKVSALPAAKMDKPEIAGRWSTGTNTWEFGEDGSWSIVGTRNKGQWKTTAGGIAIKYSGASVWINLKLDGETLVDTDGYIGKARLSRVEK
jgi:hypothetical protein